MKVLPILICMHLVILAHGQSKQASMSSDLKAEINQSAFDKIVASADIPLTLFEHNDPFPRELIDEKNFQHNNEFNSKSYTYEETKSIFKWALENGSQNSFDDKSNEIKKGIQDVWNDFQNDIKNFLKDYEDTKAKQAQSNYAGPKSKDFQVEGYNIDSLYKWKEASVDYLFSVFEKSEKDGKSLKWGAKAWLPYARVDLTERPVLTVNSPNFSIKDFKVLATATGEFWVQIPKPICCHWWGPICTCIRFDWVWVRIVSITVSPKIGVDATVTFNIDNLKIFASGQFDRLYLDYNILRDFNLAGLGNRYLRNKKFELYDVSKFVASLPYIDKKFRIKDISLPPKNGELEVDITIVRN